MSAGYVLIQAEPGMHIAVADALRGMSSVASADLVYGAFDLIAEVADGASVDDVALACHSIEGITRFLPCETRLAAEPVAAGRAPAVVAAPVASPALS